MKVKGSRSLRNAERARRKVAELMARAGIIEPGEKGDGTLTTEPILVFRGLSGSSLIFDQYGNEIGSVRRDDNGYELRDRELRCTVRAMKPPTRLEYEFSVAGADGRELGTINRDKVVPVGALHRPRITSSPGRTIAMLELGRRAVLSERVRPRPGFPALITSLTISAVAASASRTIRVTRPLGSLTFGRRSCGYRSATYSSCSQVRGSPSER